ncbi:hypothetical protein F4803DRAFT_481932 [Xylaria telfairii]|nr:hypothetical protein F4803DRAFT_481932 [Xylaria telfairii]
MIVATVSVRRFLQLDHSRRFSRCARPVTHLCIYKVPITKYGNDYEDGATSAGPEPLCQGRTTRRPGESHFFWFSVIVIYLHCIGLHCSALSSGMRRRTYLFASPSPTGLVWYRHPSKGGLCQADLELRSVCTATGDGCSLSASSVSCRGLQTKSTLATLALPNTRKGTFESGRAAAHFQKIRREVASLAGSRLEQRQRELQGVAVFHSDRGCGLPGVTGAVLRWVVWVVWACFHLSCCLLLAAVGRTPGPA